MNNETLDLVAQVLSTAKAMNASGINRGSAGNVSTRCRDGFIITPTGMAYADCEAEDMVWVGLDGSVEGRRKPSSEWRFHRDIYVAHPEAESVIHTHSPFATSLACMDVGIPPFHYMIARFGGRDVRCADYATFGSQELSDAILRALEGRCACLMAHHGMVVFGSELHKALELAVELETLSEQFWRVLQVGGPNLIPDDEMDRVLEKFRTYGQQ
jgi:L-fuculose-phosphate aldolase